MWLVNTTDEECATAVNVSRVTVLYVNRTGYLVADRVPVAKVPGRSVGVSLVAAILDAMRTTDGDAEGLFRVDKWLERDAQEED
jgi:hypothetical protein